MIEAGAPPGGQQIAKCPLEFGPNTTTTKPALGSIEQEGRGARGRRDAGVEESCD